MSRGPKLAIAIALGLLAALFGMVYLNSERTRMLGSTETVEVYVAASDIPANTPIDAAKLTTRQIPRSYVQPQSFTTESAEKITGVTIVPIQQGEQILRTKLWTGKTPPLVDDLKRRAGMVAVTVEMPDAPQALHGLVQPRDRVDVLALLEFVKPNDEKFKEIRPLFYNVEVLAVDRTTASSISQNLPTGKNELVPQEEKVQTVTLALPPVAAQQLILAQELPSSRIWLILRSPASGDYRYETWNTDRLIQSEHRLWDAEEFRAETERDLMKGLAGR
jgi:Flp pilus assembly protein CpaB